MADKDSHSIDRSVLGAVKKVILTTIVLTHIRIFTRLILILMRNRYSYIFWFSLWVMGSWLRRKIAQKCLQILLLLYNLHIFASDFTKNLL